MADTNKRAGLYKTYDAPSQNLVRLPVDATIFAVLWLPSYSFDHRLMRDRRKARLDRRGGGDGCTFILYLLPFGWAHAETTFL